MMKTDVSNLWRLMAMFALVSGLLFFTGCSDDEDDGEPDPTETLEQIIDGRTDITDFETFFAANSATLPDISGTTEYTLFIPNDAAFDTLRSTLDTEDLTTVRSEIISSVLAFHFVSGNFTSSDFGPNLASAQGEDIVFNNDNTIFTGGSNTMVNVIEEDLRATNGVIHIVDRILIPPTIFGFIGLNLGTIAQPVLLGADFSDLLTIIEVADDATLEAGELSISEILADQTGTLYTAFLPTNAVLDGAAAAAQVTKEALIASVTPNAATARAFLLNHIYDDGILKAADLSNGFQLTMMSGKNLVVAETDVTAQTPLGLVLVNGDSNVPIFSADVFNFSGIGSGTNGALHVSSIIQ
ncbi:MAG: fasciclin domain-containing protein [Cyclobacteriaceae bacterium]|nr:fasciclin domain-containing protein [Cyclobacteriaceae bacterium HetDA_MAG_MS6]